jgi:anthranilate synthase component 1
VLAPAHVRLRAIDLSPTSLLDLHAAHPDRYPVLLESAAIGKLGAYDILLACPLGQLALNGEGKLRADVALEDSSSFLAELDRWWRRERVPEQMSFLPFTGGWFLFLGYELAAEAEPALQLPTQRDATVALALRIPAAIVYSHDAGTAWLLAEQEHESLLDVLQQDVEFLVQSDTAVALGQATRISEDPPEVFLDAVRKALEHIGAGDIYQANLSRAWHADLPVGTPPHAVYRRLRRANPGPFAGLAVLADRAILSSSPERLLEIRQGRISTRPIAGTRPRAGNALADHGLARELRQHPKEQAEHVMLIDLERNDLGRVCEPGSVQVDEYMSLESYAHVHHIVSNVSGQLRKDVTPGQAIAAVFPGGTITGCPKVRCMEIIAALEGSPRGVYTGSMGYLNRDGTLDLNILIRTLEMAGDRIVFRAGAGIVADSDPVRELEETRAKARGLVAALVAEAGP